MMGYSTIDLLVPTSLYELLLTMQTLYTFLQISYFNEEVNFTEPSPSISVPCRSLWLGKAVFPLAKFIMKMPAMVTRTVIAFATVGDTTQIKIIFMCVAPPEEGNYSLCQHRKHFVIKFANGNTILPCVISSWMEHWLKEKAQYSWPPH